MPDWESWEWRQIEDAVLGNPRKDPQGLRDTAAKLIGIELTLGNVHYDLIQQRRRLVADDVWKGSAADAFDAALGSIRRMIAANQRLLTGTRNWRTVLEDAAAALDRAMLEMWQLNLDGADRTARRYQEIIDRWEANGSRPEDVTSEMWPPYTLDDNGNAIYFPEWYPDIKEYITREARRIISGLDAAYKGAGDNLERLAPIVELPAPRPDDEPPSGLNGPPLPDGAPGGVGLGLFPTRILILRPIRTWTRPCRRRPQAAARRRDRWMFPPPAAWTSPRPAADRTYLMTVGSLRRRQVAVLEPVVRHRGRRVPASAFLPRAHRGPVSAARFPPCRDPDSARRDRAYPAPGPACRSRASSAPAWVACACRARQGRSGRPHRTADPVGVSFSLAGTGAGAAGLGGAGGLARGGLVSESMHAPIGSRAGGTSSPPYMPPMSGAGGGGGKDDNKERERTTWLQEDRDIWAVAGEAPPGVIRGGDPTQSEDAMPETGTAEIPGYTPTRPRPGQTGTTEARQHRR
ncbi:WXG100 family type VII secretion target [Catellatospora coxensis]